MLGAASAADVPGASRAGGQQRPIARSRCVALSPTNRCWAVASTEGLLLYSLDDAMLFDPTDLTEDLTPAVCDEREEEGRREGRGEGRGEGWGGERTLLREKAL